MKIRVRAYQTIMYYEEKIITEEEWEELKNTRA